MDKKVMQAFPLQIPDDAEIRSIIRAVTLFNTGHIVIDFVPGATPLILSDLDFGFGRALITPVVIGGGGGFRMSFSIRRAEGL